MCVNDSSEVPDLYSSLGYLSAFVTATSPDNKHEPALNPLMPDGFDVDLTEPLTVCLAFIYACQISHDHRFYICGLVPQTLKCH